jgi:hypothetical protein
VSKIQRELNGLAAGQTTGQYDDDVHDDVDDDIHDDRPGGGEIRSSAFDGSGFPFLGLT